MRKHIKEQSKQPTVLSELLEMGSRHAQEKLEDHVKMQNHKSLSKFQIDVIKKLQKGWEITRTKWGTWTVIAITQTIDSETKGTVIRWATVKGLLQKGLIKSYKKPNVFATYFRLTKKGAELKL